jgi:hypothetical protein
VSKTFASQLAKSWDGTLKEGTSVQPATVMGAAPSGTLLYCHASIRHRCPHPDSPPRTPLTVKCQSTSTLFVLCSLIHMHVCAMPLMPIMYCSRLSSQPLATCCSQCHDQHTVKAVDSPTICHVSSYSPRSGHITIIIWFNVHAQMCHTAETPRTHTPSC